MALQYVVKKQSFMNVISFILLLIISMIGIPLHSLSSPSPTDSSRVAKITGPRGRVLTIDKGWVHGVDKGMTGMIRFSIPSISGTSSVTKGFFEVITIQPYTAKLKVTQIPDGTDLTKAIAVVFDTNLIKRRIEDYPGGHKVTTIPIVKNTEDTPTGIIAHTPPPVTPQQEPPIIISTLPNNPVSPPEIPPTTSEEINAEKKSKPETIVEDPPLKEDKGGGLVDEGTTNPYEPESEKLTFKGKQEVMINGIFFSTTGEYKSTNITTYLNYGIYITNAIQVGAGPSIIYSGGGGGESNVSVNLQFSIKYNFPPSNKTVFYIGWEAFFWDVLAPKDEFGGSFSDRMYLKPLIGLKYYFAKIAAFDINMGYGFGVKKGIGSMLQGAFGVSFLF